MTLSQFDLIDFRLMNKPQYPLPTDVSQTNTGVWRPINYLGSKLRLVDVLRLALDTVDPSRGRCVDLFAGSGTVAAALSAHRSVTAVDIQEYSRVLCSAVLNPVDVSDHDLEEFFGAVKKQASLTQSLALPLIKYEEFCLNQARSGNPEPICELIDHASMIAFQASKPAVQSAFKSAHRRTREKIGAGDRTTIILRFYGGLFFSYRQAAELDALLTVAHGLGGPRRDFYLAAIISTASEVVNTVGKHFAQPIRPRGGDGKPKRHLVAKIMRDREIDVLKLVSSWIERYRFLHPSGRAHQAIRADYADALAATKDVAVVYADPPYTRDHYSRFYHVLETMCLWDDPGVSTTRIHSDTETFSRGMYRADRHQSPFCVKSQAPAAFTKMFSAVKALGVPLVLSYSPYATSNAHPRVMDVDQISQLAKEYFASVEIISAGKFSHMKLNATRLHLDASTEAEILFLLR
ncbi:adenine-specific DNA methylase [Rhodoblastus acidophilus]|uniref:DNA adenine methylase n=1 Tax=Rhodoblastus acidophilus TaxID=1074 RepID=UPI002224805E|nr:DNA adenine methylase [Rhodoblastus acidophilus]MCW2317279.1 adenine-specific DNA methylase [Rhodoblastus acidophilus]